MAKKVLELDTPFRKGERVLATADVQDIKQGTRGKIQLTNGLGNWRRYWVMFDGGQSRGQVSHHDLVRPDQLDDWLAREEEKAAAAARSEEAASEAVSDEGGGDGAASGIASRIPAAILERSKAAKARLLG